MERAIFELISAARDRVDFTVVSATLAADLQPFVRWRRVPIIPRPFVLKFLMFFALAGFRYRRRDVDLVYTLGAIVPRRADVMAIHFCHAAYRANTVDANLEADVPIVRRVNTAVAFWMALEMERLLTRPRWARTATAVSNGGARELGRFYPQVPVTVIPNGVDHSRFRPSPAAREAVRASVAIPDGDVVALFVGGRWSQKGLEVTIRALADARGRRSTPISLWVAGSGDVARYQRLADGLGVGDAIHFFGYVTDTERLYQGADIFVLPSAYETFCMVAYEAASTGLPVVATPVNGVEDLLADGSAGLLVDATVESVSAALAQLASDALTRRGMGSAARQQVRDLTWTATANRTVALFEHLLPTGAGASPR
jgi:glycosyltransferase involved in cell wall biosynthesis